MKNYILAFIFITSIISMSYQVSAAETQITVKTAPFAYVMIRIFEGGNRLGLLESFPDQQVDLDGEITVMPNPEVSSIDVEVFIKLQKNGPASYYKRYEGVETGKPFTVTLPEENNSQTSNAGSEENTTFPATETRTGNLTSNITISENSTAESITGNILIEADGKPINNLVIIIAVIIIVLLILFGAIMRKKMKNRTPREPNPSNATKSDSFIPKDDQRIVEDLKATQSRLDQANQELNKLKGRLKNEEKIREIENRINAEKDELRRLRQG